ncbi:hypothetical protein YASMINEVIRUS_995 [Yasminevirus sp. GU-2018]|uniref:Uncharacterized protein n=1 Tax=Yasminevirus sp. GU-2018 TaxID=2420051 RepID=A0A5K0UAK3_9VIRU|nr:hypothetical protein YASMINEVIRUS_995 [Yasminevirus sp. GU-2018]
MVYYPTENPVVGTLILLTLLYVLLRVNKIDIADFFSSDRFIRVYNENPIVVIITIAVVVYSSYSIYVGISSRLENLISERFDSSQQGTQSGTQNGSGPIIDQTEKQFMSFDKFYQTFVMTTIVEEVLEESSSLSESEHSSESESEHESEHPMKHQVTKLTVPDNRFIVLRTTIDGVKYYLVMDSFMEQDLLYKKTTLHTKNDSDKAGICGAGPGSTNFVVPVLMREDLLDGEYKAYVTRAFGDVAKAVATQTALDAVNQKMLQNKSVVGGSGGYAVDSTGTRIEGFGDILAPLIGGSKSVISDVKPSESSDSESESSQTLIDNITNSSSEDEHPGHLNGLLSEHESEGGTIQNVKQQLNDGKTDAQRVLKQTILPRYTHHLTMIRKTPTRDVVAKSLADVIGNSTVSTSESESESEEHHNKGDHKHKPIVDVPNPDKPCYVLAGVTKEQTSDVQRLPSEAPYAIDLTRNFSPFTIPRQRLESTYDTVGIKKSTVVTKMTKIEDDKKFVCGVQRSSQTKFSDVYAVTVTPSIDQLDKVSVSGSNTSSNGENNSAPKADMVDDTFLYYGRNNTNVVHMEPVVNLYVLGDFKNKNNVPAENVKCWLARLDGYTDPTLQDTNKKSGVMITDPYNDSKSAYYNKPRFYPVGIIPDDYKQCNATKPDSPESACIGKRYINGVDYSDARRIDFEVATVQLNPL